MALDYPDNLNAIQMPRIPPTELPKSEIIRSSLPKSDGIYADRKRIMESLCKKTGVRYFRYHALRHAGASIMDNSNVPIGSIQKILGHENRSTTEIYLHSFGMAERDAISVYESARQKSHTESHTDKKEGASNIANPLI